jgi:hypothetical protein
MLAGPPPPHPRAPRFPAPAAAGEVAPGMAVELAVRFTPDSPADYDDVIVAVTPAGRLEVPLRGRRPPPALTLGGAVDVGPALLGQSKRVQAREGRRGRGASG